MSPEVWFRQLEALATSDATHSNHALVGLDEDVLEQGSYVIPKEHLIPHLSVTTGHPVSCLKK